MPRVHAQIRHVTDTDPILLQPEDIIESEPEEDQDAGRRARKRRRIEVIANQYIKLGRVPLIVSAELRGPFENGWKNPWVTTPTNARSEAVRAGNAGERKPHEAKRVNPAHTRATQTKANHAQPTSSIPSPEASRAPDIAQDSVSAPADVHDEDHESPYASTALKDDTGATESFDVDPDPSVSFDNFESNPFWLKRPQPKSAAFGKSTNGNHDPSPTRARLGHRPVDRQGNLLLVTPKQPVNMLQSDPGRTQGPEPDWIPAASASMAITSPAKPTQIVQETVSSGYSTRRKRTYSKFERGSMREDQSVIRAAEDRSSPDLTTRRDASIEQSSPHPGDVKDHSAPDPDTRAAHHTSGFTPINGPSRSATTVRAEETKLSKSQEQEADAKHAQQVSMSAPTTKERFANQVSQDFAGRHQLTTSSSRPARTGQKKKKQRVNENAPSVRHDQITSPTFASSTGFMYRRIGEAKRATSSDKPEPRPVTFSSPAVAEQIPTETAEHEVDSVNEASEHEPVATAEPRMERPDVYDVPGSPQEQQEQQSYKSSRTSGFSTQAALMMAQMEFQDGTMPTIAEDAPTPWTRTSTAHEDPIIPSPAFTPFHKFNATLEEDHLPEPTMQNMPISTQDLFATVSPFANSTVKKSTKPPASNLRFSVFANAEQDTPSHSGSRNHTRSPTTSQRKPLREKNSRVSFLGSQSEKGSQGEKASQESITPRPSKAPMVQAVELPQLDFHTSNVDLDFTDRFLLNVNEMT
ncbi:uncharacterized protein N0V89_004956 [Didymosphaeria variabile]|uniref:Uncharacterized protein n=1 Tax=Didymosphaeria variabile TaxID=1932322 RepID=A0A9W9CB05_9PLEO|nr:uncharacterized protein N0V89_004956 [Didymosphaeria variabile]KAJ4353229.1 hypothetical protein N0V89_004956 [Didymosphaeria variabile]